MLLSFPPLLDIESAGARLYVYAAAASVAVVVAIAIATFLTPLGALIRRRLFGKAPVADRLEIDGLVEENGRPLSALSSVRRGIEDVAASGSARTRELVDFVIAQAWNLGASDVHLNPGADTLSMRIRIDGLLYDLAAVPMALHSGVIIRLKILSRLNVYRRDAPQDGRINVGEGHPIDIRISTLPTIHGEKAVLRFRSRAGRFQGLDALGFDDDLLVGYRELLARPQGTIFVTGPTGSGKTTTLYASLDAVKRLRGAHLNIVTIEDPVEHELPFLNQTQVNEAAGLTFAAGLRSILRQDPNVIMVGEIRDQETADIAMHAGLTGHLIFSTIHADSSPGVFARLLNMNVEPYVLASATTAVLGQRLVRRLCPHCREEAAPLPHEVARFAALGVEIAPGDGPFHRSPGCPKCFDMGVSGRTGIFELLVVDDEMRAELVKEVSTQELHALAMRRGMRPLVRHGIERALAGEVSLDEVLSVVSSS